ncbi:MAG: ribose-phosphate pyrophosphokinase [Bacteroidales bacterium]|nr:ribose-phosphate pyrophosphokinase [Bacteroidales bacterium]
MKDEIAIVAGRASRDLAEKIAKYLNIPLTATTVEQFKDGEIQANYDETIRGKHVFIIQSTYGPAENIIELMMLVDAAKRASASKIIAVMPYFGYARQDRKDKSRTSIGAKVMANVLTATGVNRLITMDLHADQIQGFFEFPVDHLYASNVLLPYVLHLKQKDLCIVSPDTGGTKRAVAYAKWLGCDFAIGYKQRAKANVVESLQIIGDVKDKNVILIDDLIDTGGTICKAATRIKELGAKSIMAMCTHPVFSADAMEKLQNSDLDRIVVTDTIPLKKQYSKFEVISVTMLFAEVIKSVVEHTSISYHFEMVQKVLEHEMENEA